MRASVAPSLTYIQDLTSQSLQAQFIFEPKKSSDGWRVASDGETGRIWSASSIYTLRCSEDVEHATSGWPQALRDASARQSSWSRCRSRLRISFFFQSFFSTKNCARLRKFSTLNSFRRRRATSRHAPRSPGAACCSLGEHRRLGPDAVPARCRRAAVPSTLRDYRNTSNRQRNGYARLRIFSPARHPA